MKTKSFLTACRAAIAAIALAAVIIGGIHGTSREAARSASPNVAYKDPTGDDVAGKGTPVLALKAPPLRF